MSSSSPGLKYWQFGYFLPFTVTVFCCFFQTSKHYGAFLDKLIQDLMIDCKYSLSFVQPVCSCYLLHTILVMSPSQRGGQTDIAFGAYPVGFKLFLNFTHFFLQSLSSNLSKFI